jgi:hypothetical protein
VRPVGRVAQRANAILLSYDEVAPGARRLRVVVFANSRRSSDLLLSPAITPMRWLASVTNPASYTIVRCTLSKSALQIELNASSG